MLSEARAGSAEASSDPKTSSSLASPARSRCSDSGICEAEPATIPFSTGVVGTALSDVDTRIQPSHDPASWIRDGSMGLASAAATRFSRNSSGTLIETAVSSVVSPQLGRGRVNDGIGWLSAVVLILATVIGSGILVLPGAVARLGWRVGMLSLGLFYCMSFFVAHVLHELHMMHRYPLASCIGDIFAYNFGLTCGFVGWGLLYVAVLQFIGIYLLDITELVRNMFDSIGVSPSGPLSFIHQDTGVVAISGLLLLPWSQCRTLRRLTPLACVSVISIWAVLVVYTLALFDDSRDVLDPHPKVHFGLNMGLAISQIAFTFTGQVIFLEIQSEMREPADFTRSLRFAYLALLVICGGVAAVSLIWCGDRTPDHLLMAIQAVHQKTALLSCHILLLVHFVASYSIFQQVLAREVALWLLPSAVAQGWKAHLQWFVLTAIQLTLALALVLWLPDNSGVLGCLAAFASTLSFAFPCVLYLASRRHSQAPVDRRRDLAAVAACGVVLCAIAGLGAIDCATVVLKPAMLTDLVDLHEEDLVQHRHRFLPPANLDPVMEQLTT